MTDGVDEDDGDEDAGDEKLTTLASCRRCNQSASSPSRKQSLMCFIFNDVLLYSCVDHHVEEDEDEEGQDLEEDIGDAGNLIEYINIHLSKFISNTH